MNRIAKLEDFCARIGIFTRSPPGRIEWGAYGLMLLDQIKCVWTRRNLYKHMNSFLIDDGGGGGGCGAQEFFRHSLANWTNDEMKSARSSLNLVNVRTGLSPSAEPGRPGRSVHQLFDGLRSATDLSVHRVDVRPRADAANYWQNERLNWWIRFLNSPENVSVETFESDDALDPDTLYSNIIYRVNEKISITCETITCSTDIDKNPLLVCFEAFFFCFLCLPAIFRIFKIPNFF